MNLGGSLPFETFQAFGIGVSAAAIVARTYLGPGEAYQPAAPPPTHFRNTPSILAEAGAASLIFPTTASARREDLLNLLGPT